MLGKTTVEITHCIRLQKNGHLFKNSIKFKDNFSSGSCLCSIRLYICDVRHCTAPARETNMGVTCVTQVPLAEGKSVQQTVELLTRRLEQMGAEKQGTFYVDCETYHTAGANVGTTGQPGKLLYIMHGSEHPLSTFALFENGPCLVADQNFDVLMIKLKGFFQNAKANKMETRGTRYQYCDFLIKIGTVTMGQSGRGISVEVDYCPCAVPGDCWNLVMEFMQMFMGSHAPSGPPVFSVKHDALYTPGDTMMQYMELLNKIRKQQQGSVAGMRL